MKKFLRIAKISGLSFLGLIVVILLLPVMFPQAFASRIQQWANQHITGELRFQKARLSFFNHFPSLTLTLYDYSLTGAAPFASDTLLAGKELGFGINLASVFSQTVRINKFYVDQSQFNIRVTENGEANYNIYKSSDTTANDGAVDSSGARLKIEGIYISNSRLLYHDRSLPMLIKADGLRYEGEADFANGDFDLVSEIESDSVDFVYDGTAYVQRKHLKAELITGINTSSLEFRFQKNNILVNQLPVDFTGRMLLLDDGYDIDLAVVSGITDFGNIFSALPPEYDEWFANTSFSGRSQLKLDMKGSYRGATGQAPDLHVHLWVKDGLIQHKGAPAPLKQFYTGVDFLMPSLNMDSIVLLVDSLRFSLNGDATYLRMRSEGIAAPLLQGNLRSQLNLGLLKSALGLSDYDIQGRLNINATTNGRFDTKQRQFAPTTASVVLTNGRIKTPYYAAGLENLQINGQLNASGGTFSGIAVQVQPISFSFDGQPFEAKAQLRNLDDLQYDVDANGHLNLTNLYKLFAIDGYSVSGLLKLAVSLHGKQSDALAGRYLQLKNSGTITCEQVKLRSRDYPLPFEIPSGKLKIDRDRAWLQDLRMNYGNNSVLLNGYARQFLAWYLQGSTLQAGLQAKSERLVVDDFMSSTVATDSGSSSVSTGVVMLPANIDFDMKADVGEVLYNGTKLRRFGGQLQLKNATLKIPKASFEVAGAQVQMEGSYQPKTSNNALFTAHLKADSFDVKRAYKEVPLFAEMASSAKYAEGLVSVDYELAGRLNEQMEAVLPSIKGRGKLTLENVKMKGFKVLGAVSKATGRDSVNNPNLKAVVIKSSIANNLMTIERTKMKVYGFRPRFEGQVSLDGRMNLRFRLGLPPFGIIGIPMTITGTSDAPKVRMRRGKAADELEEEPDEE